MLGVAERSSTGEESKTVPPNFLKSMKLNDEKKFFVNKNLFENASILKLKPLSENTSTDKENKDDKPEE